MLPDDLRNSLVGGEAVPVKKLTQRALDQRIAPGLILNILSRGMEIVGRQFQEQEISIPEVLASARAMQAALEVLHPALSQTGARPCGVVAIGTVSGDIHDIGKTIVSMMLEGAGFSVIDLGIDVPASRFVECVRETAPDIVGLSALLSATMYNMGEVIATLEREGVRDRVKVMVGGAPVSQAFADQIGADAYGADAHDAVKKARELLRISQ